MVIIIVIVIEAVTVGTGEMKQDKWFAFINQDNEAAILIASESSIICHQLVTIIIHKFKAAAHCI